VPARTARVAGRHLEVIERSVPVVFFIAGRALGCVALAGKRELAPFRAPLYQPLR
jgi:hypothetical protein